MSRIAEGHTVAIPDSVFRRAGLRDGAEVVVRAQGPGRILLECEEAIDEVTDLAFTGVYGAGALHQIPRRAP